MELRCGRCAEKHPTRTPTLLGEVGLSHVKGHDLPQLVVMPKRRYGRKALGDDGRPRMRPTAIFHGHSASVRLPCHRCGVVPTVRVERFERPYRAASDHGARALYVHPDGKVSPAYSSRAS